MSGKTLFLVRDARAAGRPSDLSIVEWRIRCWFVEAVDNEDAWRITKTVYAAEFGRSARVFMPMPASEDPSPEEVLEPGDAAPIPIVDGNEVAAWISRLENHRYTYAPATKRWMADPFPIESVGCTLTSGVVIQEITTAMGFTSEEVECAWDQSLLLKLNS